MGMDNVGIKCPKFPGTKVTRHCRQCAVDPNDEEKVEVVWC